MAWLAKEGVSHPSDGTPLPNPWADRGEFTDSKDQAAAWATSLLAKRRSNGSWQGPDSQDVWATATAVIDLSICQPLFVDPSVTPTGATPLPADTVRGVTPVGGRRRAGKRAGIFAAALASMILISMARLADTRSPVVAGELGAIGTAMGSGQASA